MYGARSQPSSETSRKYEDRAPQGTVAGNGKVPVKSFHVTQCSVMMQYFKERGIKSEALQNSPKNVEAVLVYFSIFLHPHFRHRNKS